MDLLSFSRSDSAAPHEYSLFDKGGAMEWSKREFLKAGAGVAALAAMPRAFAQWQPSQRYPDPLIKIVDPSFARYRLALAKVERIASGMRWCEGPVWVGDGRYLLWSDIPNNRIMKWEEENRRGERVPQALEQRQRQHARPPGAPAHLRARLAARDAHRARRLDHGDRRPLRRQAAQFAERHRLQVRRLDLVHRSSVRRARLLRGARGEARAADQRLSLGSQDQQAGSRHGRCEPAKRSRFFSRRVEALHHRGRPEPARGPRLRRGGGRHPALERPRLPHRRTERNARRLSRGRRRQSLDGLGRSEEHTSE